MEHTKGPWKAIHDEEAKRHKVFGPLNEYIAVCDSVLEGHPHTSKNGANAKLMAASPNMLEALEAMTWAFAGLPKGSDTLEAMAKADAAIKAARSN